MGVNSKPAASETPSPKTNESIIVIIPNEPTTTLLLEV